MVSGPSISVAMINFNYGGYVGAAVESVLSQTHPATEVVVVDDGSTDESVRILQAFGDRINLIATANRGKGAATNDAVAACTGDVVALLDSDDLMVPTRLEQLASAYAAHPDAQWVWHNLQHVDRSTLAPLPTVVPKGFTPGRHDHRAAVARGRLPMSSPATSALSWRRDLLTALLPMKASTRSQDNYLKFLTMGLAPGYVLGDVLSLQGIHSENAYTTAIGRDRRTKQALRALDLSRGLAEHDLTALHRRTVSEVVLSTKGGLTLSHEDRRLLRRELLLAGPGVAPWVGLSAARHVRTWARDYGRRVRSRRDGAADPVSHRLGE